ncbi:MAG: arylesterase [Rhodospirillales bacterium]|nr:arylesterase [Rhodospirillales bacterium]
MHRFGYGLVALFVNAVVILTCFSAAAAEVTRIVVLGDSLTAGYGLARPTSFTVRLQSALRGADNPAIIENAGVSGDTSAGGLARLDWALAPKDGKPADALIIELGANDGLRGIDPASTEQNLDAIVEKARARGVRVLLAGMRAPPNLGREYGTEFNEIFPRLAKKHGIVLYPFFLDGVAAISHLNQRDGIHPNATGVDVIVERILPYVKNLIADP